MPRRYYSSTAVATTLSGNINNSTTSITVTALSGYPTQFPYTAIIDPDTASEEVVTVTAASGTTLTVTRGSDGTSAVSHNAGAVFRHGVSARDFDEANAFANGGGVSNSLVDAKGDLITATADNTPARLAVGATNGHVLKVNSSTATGLEWGAVDGLPSQTGNTNRLLTTNGTAASWTNTITNLIQLAPEERFNIVASAATGTINVNVLTASVWYYTSNASADFTLNLRGSAGVTLSSLLEVGDSLTVAFLNTNGTTAYRLSALQIDGVPVTPRYLGGTAPTGSTSAIDLYTISVIKTAATPTYVALVGKANFS